MMLTIDDLEAACERSETLELPKHSIEGPDLPLRSTFHPYGFPVEIRTNSENILMQYRKMWGNFQCEHDMEPIPVEVQVTDGGSEECPPEPTYRLMLPLLMTIADRDNYGVLDLERCIGRLSLSRAALRHRLYLQYFLLGNPACFIATRYATPVHAACVALQGKGVLLCGDSGAGKSTLSYACARAGWTYISDDASFLHHVSDKQGGDEQGSEARRVTGDCYKVRFRPAAVQFFPELEGIEETPRAAGKPSVELPTEPMLHLARAQSATVDYIIFLNRRAEGPPQLLPYRKDVARQFMRQTPFGSHETRTRQNQAIERLLKAEVFELRYSSLDWAIDRLALMVKQGW